LQNLYKKNGYWKEKINKFITYEIKIWVIAEFNYISYRVFNPYIFCYSKYITEYNDIIIYFVIPFKRVRLRIACCMILKIKFNTAISE